MLHFGKNRPPLFWMLFSLSSSLPEKSREKLELGFEAFFYMKIYYIMYILKKFFLKYGQNFYFFSWPNTNIY